MFGPIILKGLQSLGNSGIDFLAKDTGKDRDTVLADLDAAYEAMSKAGIEVLKARGYEATTETDDSVSGPVGTAVGLVHILGAFGVANSVIEMDVPPTDPNPSAKVQ